MYECTKGHSDVLTDFPTHVLMDESIHKHTDRHIDGHTDVPMALHIPTYT